MPIDPNNPNIPEANEPPSGPNSSILNNTTKLSINPDFTTVLNNEATKFYTIAKSTTKYGNAPGYVNSGNLKKIDGTDYLQKVFQYNSENTYLSSLNQEKKI